MELKAQLAQFDNIEELVRKDQKFVCLFVLLNMYCSEIGWLKMKHEEESHLLQMETWGTCECVPFANSKTSEWSPETFKKPFLM